MGWTCSRVPSSNGKTKFYNSVRLHWVNERRERNLDYARRECINGKQNVFDHGPSFAGAQKRKHQALDIDTLRHMHY